MMEKLRANLRIIWAITAKDLLEGLRNKSAIGVILSALFVVVLYRYLPMLTEANEPLRLLIYDAGDATLVPILENSPAFDVYTYATAERVEELLALDGDSQKLGLMIPANYDDVVAERGEPELTVYLMRWLSGEEAQEILQAVEGEIAALTGVSAQLVEQRVELAPEGIGGGLMPAVGMVFVTLMIGMTVPTHLMLEEKQTKTLAALLVSPATAGQIALGKALTGLTYALLGVGVAFVFNNALISHGWLTLLVAMLSALLSVGLGLLLGMLLDSRQQLMLWAWVLLIPLTIPMFLSIMEDLVPANLIAVFRFIPTVVQFELFRVSFAGPITVSDWAPRSLLLLGWAVAVLGIVVWLLRRSDRR